MAAVDGFEVLGLTVNYVMGEPPVTFGGIASATGILPRVPSLGAAPTQYLMQANDSVTETLYTWTILGTPDWNGSGYKGPNSPTNIAIAAIKTQQ